MIASPIHRSLRLAPAGLMVLLLAGACNEHVSGPVEAPIDDDAGTAASPSTEFLATLVVSNPVTSTAANQAGLAFAGFSSGEEVVFIALPPGTFPDGRTAVIESRRTQAQAIAAMADGGFDPIPIAATAGDTLDVRIQLADAAAPLIYHSIVPPDNPPVIVRTDPPPMKEDVPLNVVMRVVFSEPIDASTLTGSSVQLSLDGEPVAGTLRFDDDLNLTAALTPAEPLVPGAEYELLITTDVEDLDGNPLAEPVRTAFTTASTGASIQVQAFWALAGPGSPYFFYRWDGGLAKRLTVTWISAPTPVIVWEIVHTWGEGIRKMGNGWDAVMHWGPDVPEGATATVEAQPLKRGERYRVSVTLIDGRSGSVEFVDDRFGWLTAY